MFQFRKTAAIAITSVFAASLLMSASAASTSKSLSSNFTLVNLVSGANNGEIQYVLQNGAQWRASEEFTLNGVGDQVIKAQYLDNSLTPASGSVVVSTDGPVGAVVQIQARDQVPTSGAYIGVSEGSTTANVPLVSRYGATLDGRANSQIIVQNASGQPINIKIELYNLTDGALRHTETFAGVNPNASIEYDLEGETDIAVNPSDPNDRGWFGSAVVTSETAGGQVAVVSNFFIGANNMQTFNAFTEFGSEWLVPLFTSRLGNLSGNPLSTPVTVQNTSGATIPAGAVQLSCTRDPASTSTEEPTLTRNNPEPIGPNRSFAFNPAPPDSGYPEAWYGACTVTTGGANVAMFIQMRFVGGDRAGAYSGILASGTDTTVVIPLYAKILGNSFASAITIQNLSNSQATVNLTYKKGPNAPDDLDCDENFTGLTIAPRGSLIQNMRIEDGPNSVPQIPNNCSGSLTVTSNQPIDSFVQFDFLSQGGDAFMAHNGFTVP